MSTKLYSFLFQPEGRLQPNFPWGWKEAGTRYLMGSLWFFIGSFAPLLLWFGAMMFLAVYPTLLRGFLDPDLRSNYMTIVALSGGLLGEAVFLWRYFRRKESVKPVFGVLGALTFAGAGATTTLALFMALMLGLQDVHYPLMMWLEKFMTDGKGQPSHTFIMSLSLFTFVFGFGAQINYIRRSLAQGGHSLRKVMALSLEPLKGSWWGATVWNLVKPVAIATLVAIVLEKVLMALFGAPQQSTVDLARAVTGGNFVMFAIMAAIGAPIFEEIVFRGFLFQVMRSSLRREPEAPEALAPNAGIFTRLSHWFAGLNHSVVSFIYRVFGRGRSDLTAVLFSSAMFSLMHMQFHPATLIGLFALGVLHAEVYRRTGSLYTSMLLHFVNNGTAVLLIALS